MNKLFVFPGFGSQQVGMFSRLPEEVDVVRLMDAASAHSGLQLERIVSDGPESALVDIRASYPTIMLIDAVWGRYLEENEVTHQATLGYGIGEVAALVSSGVISMGAGVTLASLYAKAIIEATKNSDGASMTVLGLDRAAVEAVIADTSNVWVSADNSQNQVVISGVSSSLNVLETDLIDAGARRAVSLHLPGALNSPMMVAAQDEMRKILEKAEFRDASIPFLSCCDARPHTDSGDIKEVFLSGITAPLRFREAVLAARGEFEIDIAIECGAGSILSGYLVHTDLTAIPVTQYADENGVDSLKERINTIEARQ